MKAIRAHEYGGPEVLRLEELPVGVPGEGQALVRVEAAGVNFLDIYQRSGAYKNPLPFTLGTEGAGVVEAIGSGVDGLRVGDRVGWAMQPGSYATHAVLPAASLVPLPAAIETWQAAAVLLQGMTAHYLTRTTYPLKSGDTCLVHAAAGGAGLLICQMAKMAGARVIGTTSTEQKAQLARKAGADDVILYTRQDFAQEARRLTDGKGVDVVYDSVGKDTFERSVESLRTRGYLVLFGQSSGAVAPVDPLYLSAKGSLYFTRPTLAHYIARREELLQRAGEVLGWVSDGKLKLRIHHEYALAEAGQAHADLASRQTTGKLILRVD